MAQKNAHIALAMVLGLASVTACSNNNPPAQTPADQTMTTGATTPEQYNQPSQPTQPTPSDQGGMEPSNPSNTPENPNTSTTGVTSPNNPSATGVTTSAGETPSGAGNANAQRCADRCHRPGSGQRLQIEQAARGDPQGEEPAGEAFRPAHALTDHSAAGDEDLERRDQGPAHAAEHPGRRAPECERRAGHVEPHSVRQQRLGLRQGLHRRAGEAADQGAGAPGQQAHLSTAQNAESLEGSA